MSREPRWMFVVYSVGLGALVAIAALIGGDGMPYSWLAAVGGVSFPVALGYLSWRRKLHALSAEPRCRYPRFAQNLHEFPTTPDPAHY